MAPTLSVITPSYNYARYLPGCLASVEAGLRWTSSLQHVVVDDGSSDSSWEILQAAAARAPHLTVHRHANAGQSHTLNRALELADGDYIVWLNSDDMLAPGAVAAWLQALRQTPTLEVLYGDSWIVDADDRITRLLTAPRPRLSTLRQGYNPLTCSSVIWRRNLVGPAPFDERMRLFLDMDLWFKVLAENPVVRRSQLPLSVFRHHRGQVSAASRPSDLTEAAVLKERYGMNYAGDAVPRTTGAGRVLHVVEKAAEGGYLREWRARRRLRGAHVNTLWSQDPAPV